VWSVGPCRGVGGLLRWCGVVGVVPADVVVASGRARWWGGARGGCDPLVARPAGPSSRAVRPSLGRWGPARERCPTARAGRGAGRQGLGRRRRRPSPANRLRAGRAGRRTHGGPGTTLPRDRCGDGGPGWRTSAVLGRRCAGRECALSSRRGLRRSSRRPQPHRPSVTDPGRSRGCVGARREARHLRPPGRAILGVQPGRRPPTGGVGGGSSDRSSRPGGARCPVIGVEAPGAGSMRGRGHHRKGTPPWGHGDESSAEVPDGRGLNLCRVGATTSSKRRSGWSRATRARQCGRWSSVDPGGAHCLAPSRRARACGWEVTLHGALGQSGASACDVPRETWRWGCRGR
jgi:hypothetical protein